MLYVNYEEAVSLQSTDDPLVFFLCVRLSGEMISANGRALQWRRPRWPFDMRYFYASICRVVAGFVDYRLRRPLPEPPRLSVSEVLDLSVEPWPQYEFVAMGLAASYQKLVQCNSVSNAPPFDIAFALHIAGRALDREFIDALPTMIDEFDRNPAAYTESEW